MSWDITTSSQYDEQRSQAHSDGARLQASGDRNDRKLRTRTQALKPREKGHPCPTRQCPRLFSTKYNAKAHVRVHSNERPFKCALGCGENFKWCSSKSVHENAKCPKAAGERKKQKAYRRKKADARTRANGAVARGAGNGRELKDEKDAHGGILQELLTTIARTTCGTQWQYGGSGGGGGGGGGVDAMPMEAVVAADRTCVSLLGDTSQEGGSGSVESVDRSELLRIGGIGPGWEVSTVNGFMDYVVGANGSESSAGSSAEWSVADPVRDMWSGGEHGRCEWDSSAFLR
ncbi:zinc finger protein OZF [Gracilaria domingensis]|nr:zinc finger protein OZF [Gracilaria domingensis]